VGCCDFVVMADDASLAFSEVKIGLVPATISPFVIRKIGEGAREVVPDRLGDNGVAGHALVWRPGLSTRTISTRRGRSIRRLMQGDRNAQRATKELLRDVPQLRLSDARAYKWIASRGSGSREGRRAWRFSKSGSRLDEMKQIKKLLIANRAKLQSA